MNDFVKNFYIYSKCMCLFLQRSDLFQVQTEEGDDFVPYDDTAVMVAHWTCEWEGRRESVH